MKKQKILAICILIGSLMEIIALAQHQDLLDLTKKASAPDSNNLGAVSDGLVGGSGTQRVSLPIMLTLESLDKKTYTTGERFIYEVVIANIGERPITLPWEPEKNKLRSNARNKPGGLLEMSLALVVDELRGDAIFGVEKIYASNAFPQSLKTLLPGQSVRIRVPGGWYFGDQNILKRLQAGQLQRLNVRAELTLRETPITTKNYEPSFSAPLTIELKK